MPEAKLIHKSRKYADKIMEEPTEECIREMVFQCWLDAYTAGLERGLNAPPHREDMGY